MLDKSIYVLRWLIGIVVCGVFVIWLVAVAFALLGFRETAETINASLLGALPLAVTLVVTLIALVVAASIVRWLKQPSSDA